MEPKFKIGDKVKHKLGGELMLIVENVTDRKFGFEFGGRRTSSPPTFTGRVKCRVNTSTGLTTQTFNQEELELASE